MKKALILIPFAFAACNVEISVPQAKAKARNVTCSGRHCTTFDVVYLGSTTYHVFSSSYYDGVSPFVINFSKDSLEIELMKRQIAEYDKNIQGSGKR